MQAALFTNFPSAFVEEKIVKKLRKHEIEVVRVLPCKAVEHCDLTDVDAIIVMYDYANHNDSQLAQNVARKTGKKVFFLPRKESLWSKILSRK